MLAAVLLARWMGRGELWRDWHLGWPLFASSGVALPVGIPGVSGSNLGCRGWLDAGREMGWKLGGSLGGCGRFPVYHVLSYSS